MTLGSGEARCSASGDSLLGLFPSRVLPDNELPPTAKRRMLVFLFVFIPWLLMYEWVVYLGPSRHAFETYLPGEVQWPIWQWMEVFYISPYVLVTIAPFVALTNRTLRRFALASLIATIAGTLIFVAVPAISTPRPFQASNLLGRMMLVDRMLDRNNGSASFPSFHVTWAFLGAWVFTQCQTGRRWLHGACWGWAAIVAASCVFTGMHSLVDVIAGFAMFLLLQRMICRGNCHQISEGKRASQPASTFR
jgi:membrane-associated phospholipid phosphatase